ncbi:MAG: alcohol dehydrogenase catalytic domain-containing protein [Planctomycetes bacterium]|nr:alcohol dehydrogenase catalytic domain-containing protein [Planctomycetota bacterium]
MKAAVLTGIRRMEVRDVPDPKIEKDTDVLLKIDMVGICGSDVHYFETGRIGSQVVQFPYIVGHECAATVAAVGKGTRHVKVGQKVVVEPAISCHECDQCRRGRENTCFKLRFLGTPGQGNGCLSEFIVMPEECCFPIDGKITVQQGVLCEPLAIGAYAVKQAKVAPTMDLAIFGAGPIGLSCLVCAQAEGVRSCCMTEKIDSRRETARKGGAAWVGNPLKEDVVAAILKQRPLGMDVAFECAGQQETIDQAVDVLRAGGKLMLVGIPREDRVSFAIDKIRRKEITIVNIRRQNGCTGRAIELVASGKVKPDFMVTHHFGLDRIQEAFELVAGYRDGVVKAMIDM